MAPLTFYYDDLSQPCRAVEIFLRVNNIPFKKKEIRLAEGDQFTEEFVNLNPFKKVPLIDHNGFVLRESVAILRYLCRENKIKDHWYPKDSKERAKVDEYLEYQHIGTRAPSALYVWNMVFTPMLKGEPPCERRVKKVREKLDEACDNIENIWLKGNKRFLCGDSITIADLLGVAELEELTLTDYDPKKGRPKLSGWMERVRKSTNPHYDVVHARLRKISARHKPQKSKL